MEFPRKKYANRPSGAVKLLVWLDWEIYQIVERFYVVMEHPVDSQLERCDALDQIVRRYQSKTTIFVAIAIQSFNAKQVSGRLQ